MKTFGGNVCAEFTYFDRIFVRQLCTQQRICFVPNVDCCDFGIDDGVAIFFRTGDVARIVGVGVTIM
jgi:hypothetical protein